MLNFSWGRHHSLLAKLQKDSILVIWQLSIHTSKSLFWDSLFCSQRSFANGTPLMGNIHALFGGFPTDWLYFFVFMCFHVIQYFPRKSCILIEFKIKIEMSIYGLCYRKIRTIWYITYLYGKLAFVKALLYLCRSSMEIQHALWCGTMWKGQNYQGHKVRANTPRSHALPAYK